MNIKEKMSFTEQVGIALAVMILGFMFGLGNNMANQLIWRLLGLEG